ncbi:MAG: hypothetical protein ACSLFM_11035 [Tepidiformaceae bacterium]
MRPFLIAAASAALLFGVACGGDDDAPEDGATPGASDFTPEATGTADPNGAPTQLPTRPAATPVPQTETTISIRTPDKTRADLSPDEFRALPMTTVDGFDEEGVTLETIAAQVNFTGDTVITFRGYREGAGTFQFAVGQFSEIAPNTILYLTPEGHVALKSGGIEEAMWLTVVDRITFE